MEDVDHFRTAAGFDLAHHGAKRMGDHSESFSLYPVAVLQY